MTHKLNIQSILQTSLESAALENEDEQKKREEEAANAEAAAAAAAASGGEAGTEGNDAAGAAEAAEAAAAAATTGAEGTDGAAQGATAGDDGTNLDAGAAGAELSDAGAAANVGDSAVQTPAEAAAEAGSDNLGAAAGGDVTQLQNGEVQVNEAGQPQEGASTKIEGADENGVQVEPPTATKADNETPQNDATSAVPPIGENASSTINEGEDKTDQPQAGMAAAPAPGSGPVPLSQGGEDGADVGAGESQAEEELLGDDQQLAIIPAETERLLSDQIAEATELDQANNQLMDVDGKVEQLEVIADEIDEKAATGEIDEVALESFNRSISILVKQLRAEKHLPFGVTMEDNKPDTKGIRGLIEQIKGIVANLKKEQAERSIKWKANVFTNASQVKKRALLAKKLVDQANLVSREGDISVNGKKLHVEGGSLSDAVKIASTFATVAAGFAGVQEKIVSAYKPVLGMWEKLDYSSNAKFEETIKGAGKIPMHEAVMSSSGTLALAKKVGFELESSGNDVNVVEGASNEVAHIVKAYNSIRRLDRSTEGAEKNTKAQALSPDQAKKVVGHVLAALDDIIKHDVGMQGFLLVPKEVRDAGAKSGGFLTSLSAANQQGVERLFGILVDVEYETWSDRVSVAVATANACNELLAWVEKSVYVKKGE